MGEDRNHMHYIGAFDSDWHVIDAVRLGHKTDSTSLLANLPKF